MDVITPPTSLSDFLRKPDVATCLKTMVETPDARGSAKLCVPPGFDGRELNYSLIGYAYEYWLRLGLADDGARALKSFIGYRYRRACLEGCTRTESLSFRRREASILHYSREQRFSRFLYRACLYFASYELEYRNSLALALSGLIDVNDPRLLDELDRLARSTNMALFGRRGALALGPIFDMSGCQGTIWGDGDFMIGRTLFDVKAVRQFGLRTHLYQLIGYWVLNELARISSSSVPLPAPVSSLALYLPRFDLVVELAVDDVLPLKAKLRLQSIFTKYLGYDMRHESKRLEFTNFPNNATYSY